MGLRLKRPTSSLGFVVACHGPLIRNTFHSEKMSVPARTASQVSTAVPVRITRRYEPSNTIEAEVPPPSPPQSTVRIKSGNCTTPPPPSQSTVRIKSGNLFSTGPSIVVQMCVQRYYLHYTGHLRYSPFTKEGPVLHTRSQLTTLSIFSVSAGTPTPTLGPSITGGGPRSPREGGERRRQRRGGIGYGGAESGGGGGGGG